MVSGEQAVSFCLLRVLHPYPAGHYFFADMQCVDDSSGYPIAVLNMGLLFGLCTFTFIVKHNQHEAGNQQGHFGEQRVKL